MGDNEEHVVGVCMGIEVWVWVWIWIWISLIKMMGLERREGVMHGFYGILSSTLLA
jgi:hypothetical protein